MLIKNIEITSDINFIKKIIKILKKLLTNIKI